MAKHQLNISIHQLVDFLLRTGDIDNRVFNSGTMQEGSLIHALYQSKQGPDYLSEVYLSEKFVIDETEITLSGKADGIIERSKGTFVVDEIKTTIEDLKEFRDKNIQWHLGQAKCYAYIFAKQKGLKNIGIQITYIKQGNLKDNLFEKYNFSFDTLKKDIYDLLEEYVSFQNTIFRLNEERNITLKSLEFPYGKYREGQKEFAKYCYSVAKNGGKLFVEAPTGIGKTISTLFPFLKSISNDAQSKIFYLTAKNSGKIAAMNTVSILKKNGLKALNIDITARDKICFCKGSACNPSECIYSIGYYNKIKSVLTEVINTYDTFDYDTIVGIAKTFNICPFELELDLSLFCDVIICDYNYMFDPISYMKRFFDEDSSHFLALIDEAHNLVERSRKMYSASINYSVFEKAKKSLRHIKNKSLKTRMSKINKIFEEYNSLDDGQHEYDDINHNHYKELETFLLTYSNNCKNHNEDITKELTEFYLEVNRFIKMSEYYSENYVYYINKDSENISMNLLCLDASEYLNDSTSKLKAACFFSATLTPIDYYIRLLGGNPDIDPCLQLSSPFPKDNLKLFIAPKVSIAYKDRELSYNEVAQYIEAFVNQKIGNYFVYLPSYEYLDKIMSKLSLSNNVAIHIQKKDMSDIEKELFLSCFRTNPTETHVAFTIIGGTFSEGIDLVDDRISGVLIVGIGLSRINYEYNKISQLYTSKGLKGFNYAYLYPGMNKVTQAIGRLIRSETDKGNVLLIDERYMRKDYQQLYHKHYSKYELVFTPEEYKDYLSKI